MARKPVLLAALAVPLLALALAPAPAARWWKGNIHTHTLWSDGNDFPEMVVDWYRRRGDYHFLALTDHNVLADGSLPANRDRWIENDAVIRRGGRSALKDYRDRFGADHVETRQRDDGKLEVRLKTVDEFRPLFEADGEFLLLLAEEVTDSFGRLPIHINATNIAAVIPPQHGDSVRDVIQRNLRAIRAAGEARGLPALAHVNHPNFGWAITAEDLAHVPETKFFEVFNGHPDVRQLGDGQHASLEQLWDVANALRIQELGLPPLFGVATDDSHNYHNASGSTPGRGWIQVRAAALDAAALIAAMEAGDFYASSGVELAEVRADGDELEVRVAAVDGETYRIDFVGTRAGVELGGEPVRGEDGAELPVTRRYPDAVGAVLQTVAGPRARYRLAGDELYVRAVVTSSAAPDNPVWAEQRKQAWTQPFGWGRRLAR